MFDFIRRFLGDGKTVDGQLVPESHYVMTFDDTSVDCQRPDGTRESVRWEDLGAVLIETNDTGPLGIDLMWLLVGKGAQSGCVVPQGATGEKELLLRLQELPGFDNDAVIAAMASVNNERFLCWKAPA